MSKNKKVPVDKKVIDKFLAKLSVEKKRELIYAMRSMSDSKIKKLAYDIYFGRAFASFQIKKPEDISSVFWPILFGDKEVLDVIYNNKKDLL